MRFYVSNAAAPVVCFCLVQICRTKCKKRLPALCLPPSFTPPSLTFCLPPQIAAVWSKSTQVLRYLLFSHALIPAQGNQHGGQLHSQTMLTINHPLVCQTHGDSAVEETCSPPLLFPPALSARSLSFLCSVSSSIYEPLQKTYFCFSVTLCYIQIRISASVYLFVISLSLISLSASSSSILITFLSLPLLPT